MRFNLFILLVLFLCHLTTQLNGQELERKAIQNGTFEISYNLGSTYILIIEDGNYTMTSESDELQTGDIKIDEDSFTLYSDEPEKRRILISSENDTPVRLPQCNWHELNRPNKRSSKFIVYSPGGIRIQCAKGKLRRLRN
ncbi:MAG: hypothetical protein RIC80_19320 [Cyclobacteriaceae bacterium]